MHSTIRFTPRKILAATVVLSAWAAMNAMPAFAQESKAGTGTQATSGTQATAPAAEQFSGQNASNPYFLPPLPVPSGVRGPVGSLVNGTFPLSDAEIQWVKKRADETSEAVHARVPVSLSNPIIQVAVGPGAPVPTIHVAPGFVSSISFVDQSGNPWNMTGFTVGGNAFKVLIPAPLLSGSGKGNDKTSDVHDDVPRNLLNVQATAYDSTGNMVVTLQGMNTPIMIKLRSGSALQPKGKSLEANGMTTLSVAGNSPTAPPPVVSGTPRGPDQLMMSFLQGIPPSGAVSMPTSRADVQAWRYQGQIFVRSTVPVRSPAWLSQYAQGGVNVYQFSAANVLLVRNASGGLDSVSLTPPASSLLQSIPPLSEPDTGAGIGTASDDK